MEYILAVDIGGTNSRFACFESDSPGCLRLIERAWLNTRDASSFADLLARLKEQGFRTSLSKCGLVAVAVPGPVGPGDNIEMANVPWSMKQSEIVAALGGARIFLVNDFVAQAYGCLTEAVQGAVVIQPGVADEAGPLAVIGAGTGLGHCALVPDGARRYLAVPSEAGHAAFPFVNKDEMEYGAFLAEEHNIPYAYGDVVVTGSGLTSLHRFLTGEKLSPRMVVSEVPRDSQTMVWFARFYARACRNYALTVLPKAGLYVTGGIAAQNPHIIQNETFLTEFTNSIKYRQLLERTPLRLNTNEESGLWGAAFLARQGSAGSR